MFKYKLSIPVEITYGNELSKKNLCSLINTKMHEETDELIQYTTIEHNVNYPDLLAHYILKTRTNLKKVVKSITFDKATVSHENEYAIVLKIITIAKLDKQLADQLIDDMACQMSDGLLEDGLLLMENIKNPSANEDDHYYEQYADICLWPTWIETDRYILEEEN